MNAKKISLDEMPEEVRLAVVQELARRVVDGMVGDAAPQKSEPPAPSGVRAKRVSTSSQVRELADPVIVHSIIRGSDYAKHNKQGPAHQYTGKWGALVDACGGVGRTAAAIGVNSATMYKWFTGDVRPQSKSIKAVRTVAKTAGVPSPL